MPDDFGFSFDSSETLAAIEVVKRGLESLGIPVKNLTSYTAELTDETQKFNFALRSAEGGIERYKTLFKNVAGPGGTAGWQVAGAELTGKSGMKSFHADMETINKDWDKYQQQQDSILDAGNAARQKELAAEQEKLRNQQTYLVLNSAEKQQAEETARIKRATATETRAAAKEESAVNKEIAAAYKTRNIEESIGRKVAANETKELAAIEKSKEAAWKSYEKEKTAGQRRLNAETKEQIRLDTQLQADNLRRQKEANKILQQAADYQRTLTGETERFGITWEGAFRLFLVQSLHQVFTGFINSVKEGIQTAIDLQVKISEVMTIDSAHMPLKEWAAGIRELSDSFGTSILDQTEAAYQTLSNQVAQGADAFIFMAEANKLAVTTVSTSADAINLLTSAVNSFNLPITDANKISAEFFEGINLGRFRAKDLADTFGTVGTIAHQMNATLEETIAAYSLLTIRGVTTSNALTFLRNIFVALAKPSKEMKKYFEELGVTSGEQAMKVYGFGKFMSLLQERTKGATNEIAELFVNIRGLQGALPFDDKGLKTYYDYLDKITNSTEHYGEAYNIVMNNVGKKVKIEIQQLKNYFVNDLGTAGLNALDTITGGIEHFDSIIKVLSHTMLTLAIPAIAGLIKQVALLSKAIAVANPYVVVASAAVLGLVSAYEFFAYQLEKSQKAFDNFKNSIAETGAREARAINQMLSKVQEYSRDRQQLVAQVYAKETAYHSKMIDAAIADYNDLSKIIKNTYKNIDKDIEEVTKNTTKQIRQLESDIEKLSDAMRNSQLSVDDKIFDNAIKANEKYPKVQLAIVQARQELIKGQLQQAAKAGNVEDFTKYQQVYNNLLNDEIKIRQQLGLDGINEVEIQARIRAENQEILNLQKQMLAVAQARLTTLKQEEDRQQLLKETIADIRTEIGQFSLKEVVKLDPKDAIKAIDEQLDRFTELKKVQAEFYKDQPLLAKRQERLDKDMDALATIRNEMFQRMIVETGKADAEARKIQLDAALKELNDLQAAQGNIKVAREVLAKMFGEVFSFSVEDYQKQIERLQQRRVLEGGQNIDPQIEELREKIRKLEATKLTEQTTPAELSHMMNLARDILNKSIEKTYGAPMMVGARNTYNTVENFSIAVGKYLEATEVLSKFTTAESELVDKIHTLSANLNNYITKMDNKESTDLFSKAVNNFDIAVQRMIDRMEGRAPNPFLGAKGFAVGGLVDSIPAMLAPGEFVVNKGATDKFYTQLVAMNAQGLAGGGNVATTNVGGINITVNGGSTPEKTAQIIGQELNRAIRQGTIKLRS